MTDREQVKAWRAAIAAHNRAKRNRRGGRNRDPWARAQPVRYVPAPDDLTDRVRAEREATP